MQTKQDGRLGTEKIGKLMLELALPSVLAQIVNVLYNIVDRIYIGRIPDVGSLPVSASHFRLSPSSPHSPDLQAEAVPPLLQSHSDRKTGNVQKRSSEVLLPCCSFFPCF